MRSDILPKIAENAGQEGAVIVNNILEHKDFSYGYDASKYFVDLSWRNHRPNSCPHGALETLFLLQVCSSQQKRSSMISQKKEKPMPPMGGYGMNGVAWEWCRNLL